ncbi:hypothetical protein K6L44_08195 [Gluconacetobacter entanii]|uniref:Uncharacterized protein n=2 Tax=Komagataeibacter TaxID=1434011 RepID=A0A2V4QYK9_9PROT|nr:MULTISPECIES: hypothetical protein [Acetobacteraceae]PYD68547.1 hypothetical protein CFR76_14575 [Komagataeibacter swingsii]MBV1825124.1 hypothetical protein [Komagataeibacter oboediens]MBY4639966.1 hypothetical protein [Gluconacetobacter entanii]MCW4581809.1 hypothetical protein [Gluconacetobacter entanii]MCW4585073.1 hypothetical protein [Gluconacetobacter entanii]
MAIDVPENRRQIITCLRNRADIHALVQDDHVAGTYRWRPALAAGRIDMIDHGLQFQFVP